MESLVTSRPQTDETEAVAKKVARYEAAVKVNTLLDIADVKADFLPNVVHASRSTRN